MDLKKTCLTLLIIVMMIVMLFMIKSMTISDCLGNISEREKSNENKFRLKRHIFKIQNIQNSESPNSYSLTDVESNNVSIDAISDIDETSIISSDEIFKVPLNKGHRPSISNYETTQTILDNRKVLFTRKQKNNKPIRYKRNKPSNETAVGKKDTPPLYHPTLFKETNATSFCSFSFDKKSLQEARTTLVNLQKQSVYLFYINLSTDNALENFSKEQRDNLLRWQYVLKEEKFLLNLPVDFDAITFNMLSLYDNEEEPLSIKIFYNDTNCTDNFHSAIESLRFLMWNEIFANDTKYFLCNNNFEDVSGRIILYAITNIWIGYDLTCKTVDIKDSYEEFEAKKDAVPLIGPICCYFLSLQFIWMFVVLDISYKLSDFERQNEESADTVENYCIHFYNRNERPYGLKQCVVKLFYLRKQHTHYFPVSVCLICKKREKKKSITKLVLVIYIIHVCFFICQTNGKVFLSTYFNEDYLNVVRPTEYLIYLIFNGCSPVVNLIFDSLYSIPFPISFIYIGPRLYKAYLSKDSFCPYCLSTNGDEDTPHENKSLADAFIFPCYSLCQNYSSRCSCKTASLAGLSFLICLCPIFPFTCNAYIACQSFLTKYQRMKTLSKIIYICLSFVLSYLFCLRPIISSFTFMFRVFTGFVFVALPIRADIFRYTLLIVTIVVYFLKYITEIINMNAEILDYIFEIEERERAERTEILTENKSIGPTSKLTVNYISEEMFNCIYKRLYFVKKRLYFAFFKMFVVFMFVLIVLGTFKANKNSITATDFKDVMELIIVFIGPYAISLFLKASEINYLTNKNKLEIEKSFKLFDRTNPTTNDASSSYPTDRGESTKLLETEHKPYYTLTTMI